MTRPAHHPAGTILAVKVKGVHHEGIATGEGRVIHKSKRTGRVVEEPLDGFAARRPVLVVGAAPDAETTIIAARARLGERWTHRRNCQRFVAEVSGVPRRSRDADRIVLALSTFVVVGVRVLRG